MLYQRGKVYWVKFRCAGHVYRISTGARDRPSAQRVLDALRFETRLAVCRAKLGLVSAPAPAPVSKTTPPRANMPLSEGFQQWRDWAQCNIAPASIERVECAVNSLAAFLGQRRLDRAGIEKWQDSLKQEGYAPKSINGYIGDIRAMLNRLIKMGVWHGDNPAEGIERLRLAKKAPVYLDSEQSAALMVAAEGRGWDCHAYIALMLYAGLRTGEATAARWEWIDWKRKTITVSSTAEWQPKDKDARVIPLASALCDILSPRQAAEGYILKPECKRTRTLLRSPFEAALKDAGLSGKCSPHVLRKTFASRLAQAGVSGLKLAAWMGHSDPQVTVKHYANIGQAWDSAIDSAI